jgi:hypothetical protein
VVSVLGQCPGEHRRCCAPIAGEAQHPCASLHSLLTRLSTCRLSSLNKGETSPGQHHPDLGHLLKHLGTGYQDQHHQKVCRRLSLIARVKLEVCEHRRW